MEISRSEQKRRVQEVGKLVVELASLPLQVIDRAPCSESIRALLQEAGPLSGGARQRHLRYLTKLLKTEPLDELYAYVSQYRGKGLTERKQFRELEQYRDALINEAIEEQRHCAAMQLDWEESWQSRTLVNWRNVCPRSMFLPSPGLPPFLPGRATLATAAKSSARCAPLWNSTSVPPQRRGNTAATPSVQDVTTSPCSYVIPPFSFSAHSLPLPCRQRTPRPRTWPSGRGGRRYRRRHRCRGCSSPVSCSWRCI